MDLSAVAAVLLDLDGTLVLSHPAVERAWTTWAREYGVDPAALLAVSHGVPSAVTVARFQADRAPAEQEASTRRLHQLLLDDLDTAPAAAGAHLLLRVLDACGIPWAVVTSADGSLARRRLADVGITPPLLLTVDEVPVGKPDPAPYLQAASRLGVDPARCLVVEDTEAGVAAGRAAGAVVASVVPGVGAHLEPGGLAHLARLVQRGRGGPWWRDAVGYEVYLPAFADSDGDGLGDLPGVRAHLDHLVDLGVDVVWLTPFYVSPMVDGGYDVADHTTVDPRYGGDPALDALLAEAHRRGLRVVADLVVNHTSDAHPWFRDSASSRSAPLRNRYVWRDPAPDGGPPNNWLSHFGGPAWTWHEPTGQYYLHLFLPQQPDLNWADAGTADAVDDVLTHWFARGLDGFRIDTAAYLIKHPDLPDNPALPDGQVTPLEGVTREWARQDHRHDIEQDGVRDVHRRWRRLADAHDALLVGEIYEADAVRLAGYVDDAGLHSSFWFGLVSPGWDPARVHDALQAAAATPRLSWTLGNHDRSRAASRLGGGELGRRRSLALHVLLSVLPGLLWLYQGEELGLEDVTSAPGAPDPLAAAQPDQDRGVARAPLPWQVSTVTGRAGATSVEEQQSDATSPLATTRRLLAARREVLVDLGDELPEEVRVEQDGGVVVLRRGRLTAVANLGDREVTTKALAGDVVFRTDPLVSPETSAASDDSRWVLAPQEALLIRAR